MIKLIRTRSQLKREKDQITDKKIGLVPTMGNLHRGHLTLIETSISQNDVSVVTIFVNPKQFGEGEDFDRYPRTLDEDIKKVESLSLKSKPLIIFAPESNDEIYPPGFATTIKVNASFAQHLCAKSRPGHFDGVATVIYQLFKLIAPHRAYFGQKDLQQFYIIDKVVKDLELAVDLIMAPIIRDDDGLALSSRNQYLQEQERKQALNLINSLKKIENLIVKGSKDYLSAAFEERVKIINNDSSWEYLEILDTTDLKLPGQETQEFAIIGAYHLGKTRLIDNIIVRPYAR